MQRLVKGVTILFGMLVLAGFGGALHPAGDSLAVFRLPLLVLFALGVIWSDWPRRLRWPLAGLALIGMAQIVLPRYQPAAESRVEFLLLQQNLRFSRTEDAEWLAAIAERAPHLITLQEVSGRNATLLETLAGAYPHRVHCPFQTVGGVAVLSRLPPGPAAAVCAERQGLAALQVMTPSGPLWVASLHLHWPWPYGQAEQVEQLLPVMAGLDGPVLLGGDFNAVAWSHTVRRIGRAIGAGRIGPDAPTFTLPILRLPVGIDHVLAPANRDMVAIPQPRLGSDHKGVLAILSPAIEP